MPPDASVPPPERAGARGPVPAGLAAVLGLIPRLLLWPLAFWLWPFDHARRLAGRPVAALLTGLAGLAAWGLILGTLVLAWSGDGLALPVLGMTFTLAGALTLHEAVAASGEPSVGTRLLLAEIAAVCTTAMLALASLLALAEPAAGAAIAALGVGGALVGLGSRGAALAARAGDYAIVSAALCALGILAGHWLAPELVVTLTLATALMVAVSHFLLVFAGVLGWTWARRGGRGSRGIGALLRWTRILGTLLLVPLGAFALAARLEASELPRWGLALGASVGLGMLANLLYRLRERPRVDPQTLLALDPWALFLPWALVAWGMGTFATGLGPGVPALAWPLVLIPALLTLLPLWPLAALWSPWGRLPGSADAAAAQRERSFPWQSLPYPLPLLAGRIVRLGRTRGPRAALAAIVALQQGSLQRAAGRRATHTLATAPETALAFGGAVAVGTNPETLDALGGLGPAARAIAALQRRPPEGRSGRDLLRLRGPVDPEATTAAAPGRADLWSRVQRARELLAPVTSAPQAGELGRLLARLADLSAPGARLHALDLDPPAAEGAAWLSGGWALVGDLAATLADTRSACPTLRTPGARRRCLESRAAALRARRWDDLVPFWAGIASDLADHWAGRLEAEARQARGRLELRASAPDPAIPGPEGSLEILVEGIGEEPAREVVLWLDPTPGVVWRQDRVALGVIEAGLSARATLGLVAERAGAFQVSGRIEARDFDGLAWTRPLGLELRIGDVPPRPYRSPGLDPYAAPESAPDPAFAGRGAVIAWLHDLWGQPRGAPVLALTGPLGVGKTSLLRHLESQATPGAGLHPVRVPLLGIGDQREVLGRIALFAAAGLGLPAPEGLAGDPYGAVEELLRATAEPLAGRRLLLMLDDADVLAPHCPGERLPAFLRTLATGDWRPGAEPVRLLLTGGPRLRAMARGPFSVLFAGALFRGLGPLDPEESAELLQGPVRGVLDYDPIALTRAHRLTGGHPPLLRTLGSALIADADAALACGETPRARVDLEALERAAEALIDGPAAAGCESLWDASDPAAHRVLTTLAWATDETRAPRLDIEAIEAAMLRLRLGLPRAWLFRVLEALGDTHVLEREGPTHGFRSPLYRRWISRHWPPERVRGEMPEGDGLAADP